MFKGCLQYYSYDAFFILTAHKPSTTKSTTFSLKKGQNSKNKNFVYALFSWHIKCMLQRTASVVVLSNKNFPIYKKQVI